MPEASQQSSPRTPLVSIVMPAYNAVHYIEESLRSLLGQTWPNLEIIVVDDGSQDDTAAIVGQLQQEHARATLILHRQHNQGVSAARNKGIELAQGDYIALQDADDISAPDRIQRQFAFLQQHQLALCGCGMAIFGCKEKTKLYPEFDGELKPNFLFWGRTIAGPTIIFSRQTIGDMRFNTTIKYGEDLDFILRVAFHGNNRVGNIQEPLYNYRQHDQQTTTKLKQTNRDNMIKITFAFLQEQGIPATEEAIANLFDLLKQPSFAATITDGSALEIMQLVTALVHYLQTNNSDPKAINRHLFQCLKALPPRYRKTPKAKGLLKMLPFWQRIKLIPL